MNENAPEWVQKVQDSARSTRWHASSTRWQVAREASAVAYLSATLGNERFLPPVGGWSVDYSVLAAVLDGVRHRHKPITMLELGSGAGTPWFAKIAESQGGQHISVEHDSKFVQLSQDLIDYYDLRDSCRIVHAELSDFDEHAQWYDVPSVLDAVGSRAVDVLIVDGPPGVGGHQSRMPALPVLQHLLSEGAMVVLDDVVRDEEQQTISEWEREFEGRIKRIPVLDRAAMFIMATRNDQHSRVGGARPTHLASHDNAEDRHDGSSS